MKGTIGIIGLATMGNGLALNLSSCGYSVAVYNRTSCVTDKLVAELPSNSSVIGSYSLQEFVNILQTPRKILLMIKEGSPVDQVLDNLLPLLSSGDVVADGGNSYFEDSERRMDAIASSNGIFFLALGISGGERGARYGPSIMASGDRNGWEAMGPILEDISAKAEDGEPCCGFVGDRAMGHYVKMVHNGIEYVEMELICEIYCALSKISGMDEGAIADFFYTCEPSYLVGITEKILRSKDKYGEPSIWNVAPTVHEKGTGRWAAIEALRNGVPWPMLTDALSVRSLSSRLRRAPVKRGNYVCDLCELARDSLYVARLANFAQGFLLLHTKGGQEVCKTTAKIWTAGSILQSPMVGWIATVFKNFRIDNLMNHGEVVDKIVEFREGLGGLVKAAVKGHVPVPCLSSTLSLIDEYLSKESAVNLIAAQRDYFGQHGFVAHKSGERSSGGWKG